MYRYFLIFLLLILFLFSTRNQWSSTPIDHFFNTNFNKMIFRNPIYLIPYDLKFGLFTYGGNDYFKNVFSGNFDLDSNPIILDNNEQLNDNYALITICNTVYVGKGMKMAPHAKLDDGKMDVIMIKDNFSKIELLKLFPKLFTGEHIKNQKVIYKQTKSIKLEPIKKLFS